jgi:hypothetical protein
VVGKGITFPASLAPPIIASDVPAVQTARNALAGFISAPIELLNYKNSRFFKYYKKTLFKKTFRDSFLFKLSYLLIIFFY